MEVDAIALSDFVHGDITAVAGHPCRHRGGGPITMGLAQDLERAGLVRIRTVPVQPPVGKTEDDGQGRPSSASQVDPASPMTTSNTLKLGGTKTRKIVT